MLPGRLTMHLLMANYCTWEIKKRGEKEMNLRDSKKRKTSDKLFYKK